MLIIKYSLNNGYLINLAENNILYETQRRQKIVIGRL